MRGTPLDPFRNQATRREERQIIDWYRQIIDTVIDELSPANYFTAVTLAELPEDIRGYEDIKHRSALRAHDLAAELIEGLRRPRPCWSSPRRAA